MDLEIFESRKRDHLRRALDPSHQAEGLTGLSEVRLLHDALPELDLEAVTLEARVLGATRSTPFFVAGMTAGHAAAPVLNLVLARACARRGWILGLGSQRRELNDGGDAGPDRWAELHAAAPGLVVCANLGLSQAIELSSDRARRLVDATGAAALFIHLNPLQEALQPEGTPRFSGGLAAIERLARDLRKDGVALGVKETGCGISEGVARRLRESGVIAVDVSGLGGTHWGRIEGARASAGSWAEEAARTFADWGVPTAESTREAARAGLGRPGAPELWASGGVRTGLDAAKLLALGAQAAGFAQPALAAAALGEAALDHWMETRERELRIALFCTGSARPADLAGKAGPA